MSASSYWYAHFTKQTINTILKLTLWSLYIGHHVQIILSKIKKSLPFWTELILPLIFRFLTTPRLLCWKVYTLIIGWLGALAIKLSLRHLMIRSETSNISMVKVGRRGWQRRGEEVRHRGLVVCTIVQTHHLIIMHIVHILQVPLVVLIPSSTGVTIMLMPFSSPIPTFLPHLVFSPTLVPSKIDLPFPLPPLFGVLPFRHTLSFFIWRVIDFLKNLCCTFGLHAFDIIVFENLRCPFDVE